MEMFLLPVITVSALCSIVASAGEHYYFVYEPKTWSEAEKYCRDKFSGMVTVSDMNVVNSLNKMADLSKLNSEYAWIGLTKDATEWSWSDQDFYENNKKPFRNWGSGQPNDNNGIEDCIILAKDGTWHDYPCDRLLTAICYERVSGSTIKFVVTDENMNFTEAQTYCREHHTDLASISSFAENDEIKQKLLLNTRAWIGLFRGSWKLLNGSQSMFRYWSEWRPNIEEENCAAANFKNDGKWEDMNCDTKMSSVCYDFPLLKQVTRVKLSRSSSLDVNDPAVLDELLQKLEQKLKDQGVKESFRLSWRKQSDGKVFHQERTS